MSNLGANLKNQRTGQFVQVVKRSPELDELLAAAGYDPKEINTMRTPLIGASRNAHGRVLVSMPAPNPEYGVNPYPNTASTLFDDKWTLFLFEAFATFIPDITDTAGGSIDVEPGVGVGKPGSGTGGGIIPKGLPIPTLPSGRYMQWKNLTCIGLQEILLSAGAVDQIISSFPFNVAQPALYLMELVDHRYFMSKQTLLDINETATVFEGEAWDRFNMHADNPLHLIADTSYESNAHEPDGTGTSFIPSDLDGKWGIGVDGIKGIPYPSKWYTQKEFTAAQVLDVIKRNFQNWKVQFDREYVTLDLTRNGADVSAGYSPKSKYDMMELDLRGKTFGQALDEIACRMGCVWVWDRRLSELKLRETKPSQFQEDYQLWLTSNQRFRTVGGFNTLATKMPDAVYTVHPARYCTTYGLAPTADEQASTVLQDWRTLRSPDGVESPSAYWLGAESPMFYLAEEPRVESLGTWRTEFLADHMPAFYGITSADSKDWASYIPTLEVEEAAYPWNLDNTYKADSAWFSKPYAETLQARNQVLTDRYKRLYEFADGNLLLARIPDSGRLTPMSITPSLGLQYDEVQFGAPIRNQCVYRIWGTLRDTLLMPHLIEQPSLSATGLTRVRKQSGGMNIETLRPKEQLVRIFLARVEPVSPILSRGTNNDPIMWLYRVNQVAMSNQLFPTFVIQNEFSQLDGFVVGHALNLCELELLKGKPPSDTTSLPTKAFDGGSLVYDTLPTIPKVIMTAPEGIMPVYEVVGESGARFLFIYANNGVKVTCGSSPSPPTNPIWPQSGATGIGFASFESLSDIIRS